MHDQYNWNDFNLFYSSESAEKSLAKYLHEKYENAGRDGRPVMYVGESTNVDFQLALMHMDVDESAQVLYTSMWVLTVSALGKSPTM